MGDTQDDVYAARRAQLEAQFHALPPAGSSGYWQRIEELDSAQRLPLEVLARCYRERHAARVTADAERIFTVILERTRATVSRWASKISRQARSGMASQDPADLEQVCYMKLWEELAHDGPTFLVESFFHKLELICKHVAHGEMQKSGDWKRPGVETPTRIPRSAIESIDAAPQAAGEPPRPVAHPSASAQHDLDLAEYSDLLSQVQQLSGDERTIIHGLFFDGRTQEEMANQLGVTSRTIRNRLKMILRDLRARYEGGEEVNHV